MSEYTWVFWAIGWAAVLLAVWAAWCSGRKPKVNARYVRFQESEPTPGTYAEWRADVLNPRMSVDAVLKKWRGRVPEKPNAPAYRFINDTTTTFPKENNDDYNIDKNTADAWARTYIYGEFPKDSKQQFRVGDKVRYKITGGEAFVHGGPNTAGEYKVSCFPLGDASSFPWWTPAMNLEPVVESGNES